RDERAESDSLTLAPVEYRRSQRAALTDERHRPWPRHGPCECSVETGVRAHHAHGVRSDEAHCPAQPQHVALQRSAWFTHLAKAGGDNDGAFHASRGAVADDVRHGCGRSGHQDEVHFFRDVGDAGYAVTPSTLARFGFTGKSANAPPERFETSVRPML